MLHLNLNCIRFLFALGLSPLMLLGLEYFRLNFFTSFLRTVLLSLIKELGVWNYACSFLMIAVNIATLKLNVIHILVVSLLILHLKSLTKAKCL